MGRHWQQLIHVDGISAHLGILFVMARVHQMAERCQYVPFDLFRACGEKMNNRNYVDYIDSAEWTEMKGKALSK